MVTLLLGDCLERLRELPPDSVDACVTDPPYGLGFMGKGWDHSVPSVDVWREVWRVLKPGAHLLAFFGTRTYHRGVVAIEDAGFEIRDQIGWAFGSGFPKSHDVSKAIDAAAGAVREVVGSVRLTGTAAQDGKQGRATVSHDGGSSIGAARDVAITAPATPEAQRWQGWGTALKPAWEPIVVARKPLEGTVAANVLAHGTGALNIDGCRVGTDVRCNHPGGAGPRVAMGGGWREDAQPTLVAVRWPANLIHDGSDEVVGLFPGEGDGSAARFFYCAKADAADRDAGLENFRLASGAERADRVDGSAGLGTAYAGTRSPARNIHPTVKPTDLMRYLCRLVTPPGGVVLDPFMGSGSTGRGAVLEGFRFVGIELSPEYLAIARARIEAAHVLPVEAEGVTRPEPMGQLGLFG